MPPVQHAVLGASSAHRWLTCTPSARLAEKFDNRFGRKESVFAVEGTQAHALAEAKVRRAIYELDGMNATKHSRMTKEEKAAYQGINEFMYQAIRKYLGLAEEVVQDKEEIDVATNVYADILMEKLEQARNADPNAQIFLEQRLDYSKWVPSGFGTGDCIIVSDRLLEVCDLKYGKGVPVKAENNPQLRLYALGALDKYGALFDFPAVRYTIIQPRLHDGISTETMTREDLLAWAEREVVDRAKQAWAGIGEYVPGEHCRWCSAKAVCGARVCNALKIFEYGMEKPGVIDDEKITEILPLLDDAESWIKDIRAYAENQALRGQVWPGYKLVHGKKPNRVWSDATEAEAILLSAGFPTDAIHETKLLPVGAMEKLLGKATFRALLSEQVHQGEGKLTLVPESDKRIAYNSALAAFGDMVNNDNSEKEN